MGTVDALLVTDFAPNRDGLIVEPEDIWSCSEPDEDGKVKAVVVWGGRVLRVEGRRVFRLNSSGETSMIWNEIQDEL